MVRQFEDKSPTLLRNMGNAGGQVPCIMQERKADVIPIIDYATRMKNSNGMGVGKEGDPSPTLTVQSRHVVFYQNTVGELCESDNKGTDTDGKSKNLKELLKRAIKRVCYVVRRLTPVECERLQGYPDDWTRDCRFSKI